MNRCLFPIWIDEIGKHQRKTDKRNECVIEFTDWSIQSISIKSVLLIFIDVLIDKSIPIFIDWLLRAYLDTFFDEDRGSVWFSSIWFLFQIENWKSKIHNRDFQCLIPQELKITNLQSQSSISVSKKQKIEKQYSMFWKSKIKNWKWPGGGFHFLFLRKRKTKR